MPKGPGKFHFSFEKTGLTRFGAAKHFSVILQISSAPQFSLSSMLATTVTDPAHRSDQQSDQLCNKCCFLPLGALRVSLYSRVQSCDPHGLFDQLIRSVQHRLRNREPDLPCRLEIDHELKFHRLLHRQIGGLGALEDLVDVNRGAFETFSVVG